MDDIRAAGVVRAHYPDAILSSVYIRLFLLFVRKVLRADEEHVAFLTSICSDDLNSVGMPKTRMVGPFVQGGLDGYPFAGITGLRAFSSHIPDDGAALMFFGPHVGITQAGEVGKVIRPGHQTATSCCGAAAAALAALEAGQIPHLEPPQYPVHDYQQETIRQIVLEHREEIEAAGDKGDPGRFLALTEAIYRKSLDELQRQVEGTRFDHPAFYLGGILINRDGGAESMIAIRDVGLIERGLYIDMTPEFRSMAEERLTAFEAGDADALR